jgi:hypothetical protein
MHRHDAGLSLAQQMELSKRVGAVAGVSGRKFPLVGLVCAVSRRLNSAKMKTHPNPMNRRSFLGSALAAVTTASDGLYQAFKAQLGRLKEYTTVMDIG